MKRIAISIAFCILLLSLLLLGFAPKPPPPPTEGSLALSDSPVLGKPVEVIYTFWLSDKIKWDKFSSTGSINVTATIKLSNKFQLVDGNLQWQGNLSPRQKAEIKATIKAIKKGTGEISASTKVSAVSAYYGSGNRNTLLFLVLTDRAFWGNEWSNLPGEDWAKGPNVLSVLTGCKRPNVGIATSASTTDEIVIFPRLTFPHPPSLGKTAELTLVARAYMDAPGARISVVLPKEVELVSGNLQWNGYMTKGDEIELKALVKATKVGKWIIATQIGYSPKPNSQKYLPSNYLTLYVFKDGADTVEGPLIKAIPKVNIELSLSNLPTLHKRTELTGLVVALNHDLPKGKVTIYLPLGLQLINGNPYWEGDMKKGTPIEIQMTIEPIVTGTLPLMVDVNTFDEYREIYGHVANKTIYVTVTRD